MNKKRKKEMYIGIGIIIFLIIVLFLVRGKISLFGISTSCSANNAVCIYHSDCCSGVCSGFHCATPIYCGDGICDLGNENALSCPADCGGSCTPPNGIFTTCINTATLGTWSTSSCTYQSSTCLSNQVCQIFPGYAQCTSNPNTCSYGGIYLQPGESQCINSVLVTCPTNGGQVIIDPNNPQCTQPSCINGQPCQAWNTCQGTCSNGYCGTQLTKCSDGTCKSDCSNPNPFNFNWKYIAIGALVAVIIFSVWRIYAKK